jgi:ABC-type Na+ efflux pump permease subunit
MRPRARPVRGLVRKELREYRRNRSILVGVAIFPIIFLIQPLYVIFAVHPSGDELSGLHLLLYMLAIPVLASPILAGSAVAGERQQGTLEPLLTTPVTREEIVLGKALATLAPTVLVAYVVYAFFIACVGVFADPAAATQVLRPEDIVAQVVFTPLLAALAIWIGIGVSTRTADVRVAQQLSLLGCVPLAVAPALVAFDVVPATLALALGAGIALLVADAIGWLAVAPLFDRERLISGTRG